GPVEEPGRRRVSASRAGGDLVRAPGLSPVLRDERIRAPGYPRRVVFRPARAGEDMAAADAQVAGAGALIYGKGARGRPLSGLIFKGIRFECTTSLPP